MKKIANGTLMYYAYHTQVVPTFIVSLEKHHGDTVGREVDNVVLVKLDRKAATVCTTCIMTTILITVSVHRLTVACLQPGCFWTAFSAFDRCCAVAHPCPQRWCVNRST